MEIGGKLSHSVILDRGKCRGCTTCLKRCPTEAIRVKDGKAFIKKELCIDCGECIRVCPYKAKKAVYDHFEETIKKYKWKVALPPPSLYGQFSQLLDVNYVLTGLIDMGFDDVFEVSRAAEIITEYTKDIIKKGSFKKPLINSSCPAVVKLIQTRYPELCDNLLQVISPVRLAAKMARERAIKKTGLKAEEIGVFFISPCPAKVVEETVNKDEVPDLDGIFAISEIYLKLLRKMDKIKEPLPLSETGAVGLDWAVTGGEGNSLNCDKYLAADGIENVINVLNEIENDKLVRVDFAEFNACSGGCVGGVLTVENPFVAKTRIIKLSKGYSPKEVPFNQEYIDNYSMIPKKKVAYNPVMELDKDIITAMKKLKDIEKIQGYFPGIDCGACGAPSCRVLAEDIVNGDSQINNCVFLSKSDKE